MPKYTLIHGGLIVEKKHLPVGSEVELTAEEARFINRRGKHVELSSIIKAEADGEAKKQAAIAKAKADAEAEAKARAKAEADEEAKKQQQAKGGGK